MTDKQLKNLLTPTPQKDEEFVQRVMSQLPKTDLSWRPVWAIRIVALIIGVFVLFFSNGLLLFLRDIMLLPHNSLSIMIASGLLVAVFTLWICKEREII